MIFFQNVRRFEFRNFDIEFVISDPQKAKIGNFEIVILTFRRLARNYAVLNHCAPILCRPLRLLVRVLCGIIAPTADVQSIEVTSGPPLTNHY